MTVEDGRITDVVGACHLSERWFLEQESQQPPVAEIDGRSVDLKEGLDRAAEILAAAKWPLVYGLSRSSTEGQRAAVLLADKLGANLDTTASTCHAPSIMAIQEAGESTCTLGEIRNRADLVIFWGVDPVNTHPRHFERYSVDPVGQFVPGGRSDRTVIVVDTEETDTSREADIFIKVEAGREFEVLWALRCLTQDVAIEPHTVSGVPWEVVVDLAERMKACQCGVFFFGLGLAHTGLGHRSVEALLRLTKDLNAHTRFHARRMRMSGDVTGADAVLCWTTGYPFSVNLSRGYPRYNPGEFSAPDMLAAGEIDACLLVGSEGVKEMNAEARARLADIPTIMLDHPTVKSHGRPTVRFTTAVHGVHLPGTAYRMDEVPIPLRQVLPAKYASDADILEGILSRLSC